MCLFKVGFGSLYLHIDRKWRCSLRDVKIKRAADAATDHYLVNSDIQIKFKAYKDQASRPSHKFNVNCLKEKGKVNEFSVDLKKNLVHSLNSKRKI